MCADRAHALARAVSPVLEQWEAVIEPSIPEGPALLGFVGARIAEEASGPRRTTPSAPARPSGSSSSSGSSADLAVYSRLA